MLDDVECDAKEAKAEIAHNLELVSCLRKTKVKKPGRKSAYHVQRLVREMVR